MLHRHYLELNTHASEINLCSHVDDCTVEDLYCVRSFRVTAGACSADTTGLRVTLERGEGDEAEHVELVVGKVLDRVGVRMQVLSNGA